MFIFTIYDKKAAVHRSQFFAPDNQSAMRSFFRLANDSSSDVNLFPSDFALYCVGELNIDSGHVSAYEIIEHVVDADNLIKVSKNSEA